MNTTWKIKEQSFELDLDDANDMERYETAFQTMKESSESMKNSIGKASEKIKAACMAYRKLIDDIFGSGSADKIIGPSCFKLREHEEMVESFMEFVKTQTDENKARISAFSAKYKPSGRVASEK